MKLLLTLCLAAAGFAGLAPAQASAAETTVKTLPSVVHMAPTVVLETGRRHYYRRHHYNHRRWHRHHRHHRRYYY